MNEITPTIHESTSIAPAAQGSLMGKTKPKPTMVGADSLTENPQFLGEKPSDAIKSKMENSPLKPVKPVDAGMFKNSEIDWGALTLRTKNRTGIYGALPHAAVRTLMGGVAGAGVGAATNRNPWMTGLAGAGLGLASSVPDMITTLERYQAGQMPGAKSAMGSQFSQYPYKQAPTAPAAVKTANAETTIQAALRKAYEKQAAISLDIEVGDTLLGGRFKNVPFKVKTIGTDKLGQPTYNGKKLLSVRINKKLPKDMQKEAALGSIFEFSLLKAEDALLNSPNPFANNSTFNSFPRFSQPNNFTTNNFSTRGAQQIMAMDTSLSPIQQLQADQLLNNAEQQSAGRGLFSTMDIVKAGVGAGIGFGVATGAGKLLGTVFGLPISQQRRLAQIGAIGGALKATGILR